MPDRHLDSLSTAFRPSAMILLARLVERGLPILIVQTLRTEAEHQANLASGASTVSRSKHLPRRLRGWTTGPDLDKADAMDLAPYETYQLHGPDKLQWSAKDPAWLIIGEEAEKLGLRWGGRWHTPVDPGHVELTFPEDQTRLVAERSRPWPPPALA
jgi:peptidoglycan L-alanyl-D-glutamate endopeptidase CwlK